jgi:ectoine hydroxylase-related dioxygenase (phytanoyl-CoA dioxygenase family)
MVASDEVERRRPWEQDGFFIVRRLVSPEQVSRLSEACDHVLQQVRAGSSTQGHVTTHVAGLLAPDYFVQRPEVLTRLSDYISSREVIAQIHDLGRPGEGLPNLRDTQYFHEPSTRDYDGPWHRDGDGPTLLRFRIAFAHDDHLEYVPGSHARPDTPEEQSLLKGPVRNAPLASASVRIDLEPGDVCVFDASGIHRARYRRDRIRRKLDLLFGFGPRKRVDYATLRVLTRS